MPAVITQAGALNTTALIVPNAYIQIIPPSINYFNGVPTNIIGVVGTAQWGPVNVPQTVSSMASYSQLFGAVQARKFDMGTGVATAVQQGRQQLPLRARHRWDRSGRQRRAQQRGGIDRNGNDRGHLHGG